MPMCRILQDYYTVEGWKVGDVVEITNPTQLIREGKVVMLNDKGEEIAPTWASLKCPICIYEAGNPVALANHILDSHAGKRSEVKEEEKPDKDAIKAKRIAILEKARAARRLKQLEENVKKKEEERDVALKEAIEATKLE